MKEFILDNYRVQSTGADGGSYYLLAKVDYHGTTERRLVVLFKDKYAVKGLDETQQVTVKGELMDEGDKVDLILNQAIIEV